jgi:DNA-directed RNA polymerase specialized sigma subunit
VQRTDKIIALERESARIDNALSVLDEDERTVLELRYIKGFKWYTVSYKLNRCYQQCKRIESKALKRMILIYN